MPIKIFFLNAIVKIAGMLFSKIKLRPLAKQLKLIKNCLSDHGIRDKKFFQKERYSELKKFINELKYDDLDEVCEGCVNFNQSSFLKLSQENKLQLIKDTHKLICCFVVGINVKN